MAGMKRKLQEDGDRRIKAMTLGDLKDSQVDIFCWCNRCSHNAVLPLDRLLPELGPTVAVPEIGARLRCSGCGSKDVATRPAWPSLGQVTRHSG